METKKKVLIALVSLTFAIATALALFFSNTYLNFEINQTGSTLNFAQILILTVGIFWTFAWLSHSVKYLLYFIIGLIMILISLTLFTHLSLIKLNFLEQTFFSSYSIMDSLALCFAGLFLMIKSYLKNP